MGPCIEKGASEQATFASTADVLDEARVDNVVFDAGEGNSDPIAVAEVPDEFPESTANALSKDYEKWEDYSDIDDMDDIDGDIDVDPDLDALKGPAEEIARIHRYWDREHKKQKRREAKPKVKPQCRVEPSLLAGPVTQRPCEYRPGSDPEIAASKAITRDYNKWKQFDANQALLELDNEGTTSEGTAMRCTSTTGSAMISTENYTKDREEYELDQDIEKNVGGLKKVIAQRLKDASGLKVEGNALLQQGRVQDARATYERGIAVMDLCQQATVLMADSMAHKST